MARRTSGLSRAAEVAEQHNLGLTHPDKYSARRSRGRSESKRFGRWFNRVRQWRSRWLPRPQRELRTFPVSRDDVILGLIAEFASGTYRLLAHGYATLWFTTPFWVASFAMSMLAIFFYILGTVGPLHAQPPFPRTKGAVELALLLGETSFHTSSGSSAKSHVADDPAPRPLHRHHGARCVGTGKTSGSMYSYVEQLLRWKAGEDDKKVGGLVPEIKGDFCVQVESILARANRPNDCIAIRLDTGVC